MRELTGNFDPNSKLKWGIGFIAPPGTGPKTMDGDTRCKGCAHLQERLEPMEAKGDIVRHRHLFFCGKVVEKVGPIKAIDKETLSCREFEAKPKRKRS